VSLAEPLLLADGAPPQTLALALEAAWSAGRAVGLAHPTDRDALAAAIGSGDALAPWDAAVVLGSGGSSGGRRWCVQPLAHLQASADATATWLRAQGLDPASCLHLDPLPLHHVSGILPLVRCRRWGAELRFLPPEWLRDPALLAAACPLPAERPVLLSLVPTQLGRLMASPQGLAWLLGCRVIWVGGAGLSVPLAEKARQEGLRLAPCYGSTESAAMVAALEPERFLAGEAGCGFALADVELRLAPAAPAALEHSQDLAGAAAALELGSDPPAKAPLELSLKPEASAALEVRTARLSPGWLEAGRLCPLPRDGEGWWRSGDGALLVEGGLTVLGRLDGALHSGGETVFPEVLEGRLLAAAAAAGLPLEALLLLGFPDVEWGERLVALVRPGPDADAVVLLRALEEIAARWWPAERPRCWQLCPSLEPTAAGKWERSRWRQWLEEAIRAGS
jgi:O-succinylbenzoic acid--CoA ligase